MPDYDLLAAAYLQNQDMGRSLRDLVRMVTEYRRNNAAPGRRSARKADLNAVAKAAMRLRTALDKIDPRTRLEAFEIGAAQQTGSITTQEPAVAREQPLGGTARRVIGLPDYQARFAGVLRLVDALDAIADGFATLADGETVSAEGGRPQRHDALQMGLEGLLGLWRHHRPDDPPDQSEKQGGFLAFAWDVFAVPPAGFDRGTVQGAVIDLLRADEAVGAAPPPS